MITNGGTVGNALWFNAARLYYIPDAPKGAWSNFLIDTFDVTVFVTPEEWARIPETERTPDFEIPGASIFHTKVVNEVQIELTMIEEYITKLDELKAEIVASGSTPELEQALGGAQFVLDESIHALTVIAKLKGPDLVDRLEDAGLDDMEWGPALFSKGDTAMRVLTDTDGD